ncbi:MAG: hypothetical protein HKP30_09660 [Myxococcales bacterium]|nr:hypothetical protein [Myxococcales bacterium]
MTRPAAEPEARNMISAREFAKRVSHLARRPGYPGLSLRPDGFAAAERWYLLSRMLRRGELRRRSAVPLPPVEDPARLDPALGYLVRDLRGDARVEAAIEAADVWLDARLARGAYEGNKTTLHAYSIDDLERPEHAPFLALALHPWILDCAVDYLGMFPVLQQFGLWYSPNDRFEGNSQLFHFDHMDRRQLKVFVHVRDVGEDDGPLTIVPAAQSRTVFEEMRRNGLVSRKPARVRDERLAKLDTPFEVRRFTGPRGTAVLVDTFNCYHHGSRPTGKAARPRRVIMMHYTTPFAANMPAWLPARGDDDPARLLLDGVRFAYVKRFH